MRSDVINSSEIKANFDKQFLASAVNEFETRQTEPQPLPIFTGQSERIPFPTKTALLSFPLTLNIKNNTDKIKVTIKQSCQNDLSVCQ